MALICANGMRTASGPNRMFSGVASVAGGHRKEFATSPLNWSAGWHTIAGVTDRAAVPEGTLHPTAWVLPQKAGGMASRNAAVMALAVAGLAVGGITTTGTASMALSFADAAILPVDDTAPARTAAATFAFTVADAAGSLITSAEGASTFAVGADAELLGILTGGGSAAFTVSTSNALLGADAGMVGASSWALTAAAGILPADDTPPARTATSTFSFSGALTPYAIGIMEGSTVDNTVLTGDTVAAAVWAASQSAINNPGTAGAALLAAGSAGDPWSTALPGAYGAGTAGAMLSALINGLTPTQAAQLLDTWQRLGLDADNPLVTTSTSIEAGGVSQTIDEAAGPTITVTRNP